MWPQNASGWTMLSEKERLDGAETILATSKVSGLSSTRRLELIPARISSASP